MEIGLHVFEKSRRQTHRQGNLYIYRYNVLLYNTYIFTTHLLVGILEIQITQEREKH